MGLLQKKGMGARSASLAFALAAAFAAAAAPAAAAPAAAAPAAGSAPGMGVSLVAPRAADGRRVARAA